MYNNKVTFGFEQVHIAFKEEDTGSPAWGTPEAIPGAVRFTPTAEGDTNTFYADNSPYFVVTSNNGYTAELEMALVPDEILAEMLGWEIDENGMLVEVANGPAKPFALMGQVEGDQKNRRFVYYECLASRPEKEHATKTETLTPTTDVLKLTISPIVIDGKKIVKGTLELNASNDNIYNHFFDAVVIPNAIGYEVNTTGLEASIALAVSLSSEEYTSASWDVLSQALVAAQGLSSPTQQQVNAAKRALDTAILGLVVG